MARGSHKVNPIGFRIGINKNWNARWFASKNQYADVFLSDKKLRDYIEKKLKPAGVASIIIKRNLGKIIIEISVAKPGIVIGKGGSSINDLKSALEKISNQSVEPKILEIKNPEIVAKLVAESIAAQCERRVNPVQAADRAIQQAKDTGKITGITIWVGGRIKGADMSRVEKRSWSEGRVPRQTLRADIDYAFTEASVPAAGKHGIKVWINKGEKSSYQLD